MADPQLPRPEKAPNQNHENRGKIVVELAWDLKAMNGLATFENDLRTRGLAAY